MKTKIYYSKLLQIGLLLTFLLPFFPKGCDQKNAQVSPAKSSSIVTVDSLKQDSNSLAMKNELTVAKKSTASTNGDNNKIQSHDSVGETELSTMLSSKSQLLKVILRPNDDYTGLSVVIDGLTLLKLGSGLLFVFVLWIIALIVKMKDYNSIFNLINLIGLLFLFVSNMLGEIRLWGFWVCFIWGVAMIVYDTTILLKLRNDKTTISA